MKTKTFLLLVFATAIYASARAQCSTPPLYLNSAYETNNGSFFEFVIQQPVCDTLVGYQIQWKGVADENWSNYTSTTHITHSEIMFLNNIVFPFNAGEKYLWRVRTITYKPNGNPSYSSWTNGKKFTPEILATSGCTYPGPISLFSPSATEADLLSYIPPIPPGWNSPTKSMIQYRVDGTTGWVNIPYFKATDVFYQLRGLTPNTTYNWRMKNKCGTNGHSVWQNGPDFTTALAFTKQPKSNGKQIKTIIQAEEIQKYPDDESTDEVSAVTLKVSPNPASSQINISINTEKNGMASMMIKDLTGNVRWSATNVNLATLKNMRVNTSNLMPGIYSLQIMSEGNLIATQKIIISR